MKNKTQYAVRSTQYDSDKGFTLIEMLVVLMIIGILAAVAVPRFLRKAEISRWGESVTIARSIIDSETHRCSAGTAYTTDNAALDVEIPTMRYFSGVAIGAGGCASGIMSSGDLTFTRGAVDNYGGTSGLTAVFTVTTAGGLCVRTTSAGNGTAAAWVEENLGAPACP